MCYNQFGKDVILLAKTTTSINIDTNVKAEAQALFSELGLDLSTAVGLFLRQAVRERRIPFEIRADTPALAYENALTRAERRRLYFADNTAGRELTARSVEEIDRSIREGRENDRA